MPFSSPLSVFSLLQGHCLWLECIQNKPLKITHKMFLFVSSYLLLTSSYVWLMLLLVSTSFMMLYQDLSITYLQIADNIYTNSTSHSFMLHQFEQPPVIDWGVGTFLKVIKWFFHLSIRFFCFCFLFFSLSSTQCDTIHPQYSLSSLWVIYRLWFFIFSVVWLFLFQWFSNPISGYRFIYLFIFVCLPYVTEQRDSFFLQYINYNNRL